MAELTAAGPVLVHFWDPTQLNSVRALPYVAEWNRRYSPHGLTTLGIHSPRFALTADAEVATGAIERLEVEHAVALDVDYAIWHDYGCIGWPSLFLWGQGGSLRWAHRGEGEYRATEEAIQDELRELDATVQVAGADGAGARNRRAGSAGPRADAGDLPRRLAGQGVGGVGRRLAPRVRVRGGRGVGRRGRRGRDRRHGGRRGGRADHGLPRHARASSRATGATKRTDSTLDVPEGTRVWAISFAPGTPQP